MKDQSNFQQRTCTLLNRSTLATRFSSYTLNIFAIFPGTNIARFLAIVTIIFVSLVHVPAVSAQVTCKPLPKLWPISSSGVIKVPYSMVNLNSSEQTQVLKAIAAWEGKAPVDFFEATHPGPGCAYLSISRFDPEEPTLCWPCWSNGVGYLGKGETVNRVAIVGCFPKDPSKPCTDEILTGNDQTAWAYIAHELGHILGLSHEHQRREREGLLDLKQPPTGHQFTPFSISNFVTKTCYLQPRNYDFSSIMHYVFNITDTQEIARLWRPAVSPSNALLFNPTPVGESMIKSQLGSAGIAEIGLPFRRGVTDGDAQALRFLYFRIGPEKNLLASETVLCD